MKNLPQIHGTTLLTVETKEMKAKWMLYTFWYGTFFYRALTPGTIEPLGQLNDVGQLPLGQLPM